MLYSFVNTVDCNKSLGETCTEKMSTFSDQERIGLPCPMMQSTRHAFSVEIEMDDAPYKPPIQDPTTEKPRETTNTQHLMETEDSQDSNMSDASDTTVELDGRSFCNVSLCPADTLESETSLCTSKSNTDSKTSPDSGARCNQRITSCGEKLSDSDGRRADGSALTCDPLTGGRSMSSSMNKITFYSKQKRLPNSAGVTNALSTDLSHKSFRTGGRPPSESSSGLSNVDKIGFEAEAVSARIGQWQGDCVVAAGHERRCPTKGKREVRRLFIDENTPGAKRELRSVRRGVGIGGGHDRVQRRHSSPLRSRPVIRTTATIGRYAQHQRLVACKRTAENQKRC